MLDIRSHQGKANQNLKDTTSHPPECLKKEKKMQTLTITGEMWKNWNSQLVGL